MVRLLLGFRAIWGFAGCWFQSHNGAIAADGQLDWQKAIAAVSIPQWCDCCAIRATRATDTALWFQSHNGAIAANRRRRLTKNQTSFNPTMVRLLLQPVQVLLQAVAVFQSHNGAIAAGTGSRFMTISV